MKYGRIAYPEQYIAQAPSGSGHYRAEGILFSPKVWTQFDETAKPGILGDPVLEIVDEIPALVDDRQATVEELRAALRTALEG